MEAEGERFVLPFSLESAKQHVRLTFDTRGMCLYRGTYQTPGGKIAAARDDLEKGKAAAIFQLRLGHWPLNHFLKRIQAVQDD